MLSWVHFKGWGLIVSVKKALKLFTYVACRCQSQFRFIILKKTSSKNTGQV